MTTQTEIIKATCNEPEGRLFKAVMRQVGDWDSIITNPEDYRDAGAGVSGFIYYNETVKFAKKHLANILIVLNEFENECGILKKPTDEMQLFNWYAWFALEHCIQKVIDYKEGVYA